MMDGGYEISSASDDEPMRKLFLFYWRPIGRLLD